MLTRAEFDRCSDDDKFDFLYRYAVAAERASEALAATMELLDRRLRAIETKRSGSAS